MNADAPRSFSRGYASGYAFLLPSDELLDTSGLVRYFSTVSHRKSIALASTLDGGWWYCSSWDSALGEDVVAVVDHRASRSLYYRMVDGQLRVREDGYALLKSGERCDSARWEDVLFFSEWGFTPGDHTLHPDIYRIPAGCGIYYDSSRGVVETIRYDHGPYQSAPLEGLDYEEARRLFLSAWERSVERLGRVISGRSVILPLTAGIDSRLIAVALQRLGVASVTTCTYGRTDRTAEVQRARLVSCRLGFPHRYLSTIPDGYDTRGYTEDPSALDYLRYISGLGSGYFFAEYTTARRLSEELAGGVVLPGHNGDILGGDNAHLRFYEGGDRVRCNARLLCYHEGGGRRLGRKDLALLTRLHEEIFASYPRDLSGRDAFRLFRDRESLPKYYINSSRSWRYFGLEVWMPYLDRGLCDLMHRMPLEWRVGKRLYESVTREIFRESGVAFADDASLWARWQHRSFRMKQYVRPWLMPLYVRRPRTLFSSEDDLGFDRLMGGALLDRVEQSVPWRVTTINGLSFAWWLWYNGCID